MRQWELMGNEGTVHLAPPEGQLPTSPAPGEPPGAPRGPLGPGQRGWRAIADRLRAVPRLWLIAAAAIIAIVVIALVVRQVRGIGNGPVTASGTIEAVEVDLASKVPGRLAQLLIVDGQHVRAGQAVAQLDAVDQRLALQQAQANETAAEAKLSQAQSAYELEKLQYPAAVEQAKANVAEAEVRVPQAGQTLDLQSSTVAAQLQQAYAAQVAAVSASQASRSTLAAADANVIAVRATAHRDALDNFRAKMLYQQGYISAQALDAARAAADSSLAQAKAAIAQRDAAARQVVVADAGVKQAQAAVALAEANGRSVAVQAYNVAASAAEARASHAALNSVAAQSQLLVQRKRDVDVARASLDQARAALDVARTQVEETTIRAPFDGVIFSHSVEAGDLLAAGAPVVNVIQADSLYLRVYVTETDLARIAVGRPVDVVVDGLPNQTFHGTVAAIDDQAQFTPSNVQTKDQRAELVFGVKIDLHDPTGALKPGLPADATIALRP
jgi:HlyD family secretion protein